MAILLGVVLGAGWGAALAAPGSSPVAVRASNAGWFDGTGFHDGLSTNYGLGPTGVESFHGGRLRNFFVFDLSDLTGQVLSAELSAPSYGGYGGPAVLTLYDVSTSPATLGATVEGATQVFDDLGSGTSYGAVTVADPTAAIITVPLSAAGVRALQVGLGRTFAIGGDYAPGETTAHSTFHGTHDYPVSDVRLLVTLTSASTTTVTVAPAPTTTAAPTTVPGARATTTVTSLPTRPAPAPSATTPTTAATALPRTRADAATGTKITATTAPTATTATTATATTALQASVARTGHRALLAGSPNEYGAGAIAVVCVIALGAFLVLGRRYV